MEQFENDREIVTLEMTDTEEETYTQEPYKLVLKNDDYNSFDHVIMCMMVYLMKTGEEAMKIAVRVHTKGKDIILGGKSKEELQPVYETLRDEGLTVVIEK